MASPTPQTFERHGNVVIYQEDDATVWDFTTEAQAYADQHGFTTTDAPEGDAMFEELTTDNDGNPIFSA